MKSDGGSALPTNLRGLRARGCTSVSLPELFHAADERSRGPALLR